MLFQKIREKKNRERFMKLMMEVLRIRKSLLKKK